MIDKNTVIEELALIQKLLDNSLSKFNEITNQQLIFTPLVTLEEDKRINERLSKFRGRAEKTKPMNKEKFEGWLERIRNVQFNYIKEELAEIDKNLVKIHENPYLASPAFNKLNKLSQILQKVALGIELDYTTTVL